RAWTDSSAYASSSSRTALPSPSSSRSTTRQLLRLQREFAVAGLLGEREHLVREIRPLLAPVRSPYRAVASTQSRRERSWIACPASECQCLRADRFAAGWVGLVGELDCDGGRSGARAARDGRCRSRREPARVAGRSAGHYRCSV